MSLRSTPRPLLALLLGAAVASEATAQSTFVYTLRENGALFMNGTQLEKAPGNFIPDEDTGGNSNPLNRYQDMEILGSDRWLLRVDGRIQKNGQKLADLPSSPLAVPNPFEQFWWRLDVDADAEVYAMRLDGTFSVGGAVVGSFPIADNPVTPSTPFYFLDIVARPTGSGAEVYGLRSDGSVFRDDNLTTPGFLLDPEAGAEPGQNAPEGVYVGSVDPLDWPWTVWQHIVYDPVDDSLLAMRSDGAIMRLDPAAFSPPAPGSEAAPPNGVLEAKLPVASNIAEPDNITLPPAFNQIYRDLEVLDETPAAADPGTATSHWYALRQDGRLFSSSQAPPGPSGNWEFLADLPGTGNTVSAAHMDLGMENTPDGPRWFGLRFNGKVAAGEEGQEVLDVKGTYFWHIDVSNDPPDGTKFKNQKPKAAIYKTRITTGQAVEIPIILSDSDKPTDQLEILFDPEKDAKKLPEGYVFDTDARVLSFPAQEEKGGWRLTFRVDDGSGKAPRRFNYPIKVLPLDDKPDKNKTPIATKLSPVLCFVEQEMSFPILVTDRDPEDTVTVEPIDLKGDDIFDEQFGATFDPKTNTVTWTPTFEHLGKHRAVFWVRDDGDPERKRKLTVRLQVVAQLVFDVDEAEG